MKLMAWMLLFASGMAGAAERPQDFAYGLPIQVDARDALYEIELPAVVYRGVTRGDLGDLRVFNAQGEVVPHAFRPRARAGTEKPAGVDLPFFPLHADAGGELESMNVRVQKRADGTIVSIRSGGGAVAAQRPLRGYVLDASRIEQPLQALSFEWKRMAEGYSGKVRIEGSDDFARWSVLTHDASLVSLEFGGHRLEQKRVELRGQKHKYLRVSWPGSQQALELTAVRAETVAGAIELQRAWQAITASSAAGKPGEYEYDLGGHFPFDRLRIDLPQENTVVQLRVLARDNPSADWRPVMSAVAYRLRRDGEELKSPGIVVSNRSERHWLLRIDQKGGGVGEGAPVMHIGWVPQRLVFAARGHEPFQLAYGNRAARTAAYPIASLIPGYNTESELRAKPVVPGEQVALGGAAQLREPIDYRKWALWASLILGVAVLGWMTYRLSRQMSKPRPDPGGKAQTMRASDD